jgi:phosphopantetheinyl transferase
MIDTNGIELWLVDLSQCAPALEALERDTPRLAHDDRDRAQAIADPRERSHRFAAYAALRVLLERCAGSAVRGQRFVRVGGLKPRLGDAGVEFNLSHAEGLALIGVSRALPLGVDLEKVRPAKMSPRRLSEIIAIGAGLGGKLHPSLGVERTFIQAWARLEAFSKARGRGLAQTLTDLGLRGPGRRQVPPTLAVLEDAAHRLARKASLTVHDVRLPLAFHGAIAAPRGAQVQGVRSFPADRAQIDQLLDGQM